MKFDDANQEKFSNAKKQGNFKTAAQVIQGAQVSQAQKTAFSAVDKQPGFAQSSAQNFKESSPDIRTDQGYNIGSRQEAVQQGTQPQKMKTVQAAQAVRGSKQKAAMQGTKPPIMAQSVQPEMPSQAQQPVQSDMGSLFTDKNDDYIRFSRSEGHTSEREKFLNPDKMALGHADTQKGGGADFNFEYTDKGRLTGNIVLKKDKERTDISGFKNKSARFVEKAERFKQDFSAEENEADASFIDSKAEILFEHKAQDIRKTSRRYKDIKEEAREERKSLEKEIRNDNKQIKKEIKKEQKEELKQERKDMFQSSRASFSDDKGRFDDNAMRKFKGQKGNATGKFISDEKSRAKEKAVKANAVKDAKNEKRNENGKFAKDDKSVTAGNKENSRLRSNESYFKESSSDEKKEKKLQSSTAAQEQRFMTKEERLEQSKTKEKTTKKSEKKEVRKAAAVTALSKVFQGKKDMQNQLGDMSGQSSGDFLKDGNSGLLKTMSDSLKNALTNMLKSVGSSLFRAVASVIGSAAPVLLMIGVIILMISGSVAAVTVILFGDGGAEQYELNLNGDGIVYSSLSDDDIDYIIDELKEIYENFSSKQKTVLRYALSKVGCPYDQDYHSNLRVDIFDCSSLAYRAYLEAGIEIDYDNNWTAAAECYAMDEQGNIVIDGDLQPGDLIFYGGSDNGRYLGTYHVAIYVGKIDGVDKMVEARGTSWGVVLSDVRASNVVRISRPY